MYVTYEYTKLKSTKDVMQIIQDVVKIITFESTSGTFTQYNSEFETYIKGPAALSGLAKKDTTLINTVKIIDENGNINFPDTNIYVLPNWKAYTETDGPFLTNHEEDVTKFASYVYSEDPDGNFTKYIEFTPRLEKSLKSKPEDIAGEIVITAFHHDIDSELFYSSHGYNDKQKSKFPRPKIYANGGFLHISASKNHLMISSSVKSGNQHVCWTPGIGVMDFEPYRYVNENGEPFGTYFESGEYPTWCYMSMLNGSSISLPKIFDVNKNEDLYYSFSPFGVNTGGPKTLPKTHLKNIEAAIKYLQAGLKHIATGCTVPNAPENVAGKALFEKILNVLEPWKPLIENALKDPDANQDEINKFLKDGEYYKQLDALEPEAINFNTNFKGAHVNPKKLIGYFDFLLFRKPVPPNPKIPDNNAPNSFQLKSQYLSKLKDPTSFDMPKRTVNYNFNSALVCARIGIQNTFVKSGENKPLDSVPMYYDIGGDVSSKTPIYIITANSKALDHISVVLPQDDEVPIIPDLSISDPAKLNDYTTFYGDFVVWDSKPTNFTNPRTNSKIKYIVPLF